jgi:tetratricopeptide (TPR) repeat protein
MNLADQIHAVFHQCFESGQNDVALWLLSKMIDDYPDHALAHYDRGVLAHDNGDLETAGLHFERAAELLENNVEIQKNLAHFYHVALGDSEKSLNQYAKVLSLNGRDTDALMIAGHLSVGLHRFEDAKKYYSQLLSIEPWHADVSEIYNKLNAWQAPETTTESTGDDYEMGIAKAQSGDIAGAIECLESVVSKNPRHALAHNDLGVMYYQSGKKDSALKHYEEAAQLEPDNAVFQKNLGDFYCVEQGNLEGALEKYLQALNLDAEDVETLISISRICLAVGKKDDAHYFLGRVLEIDPQNHDALHEMGLINSDECHQRASVDSHGVPRADQSMTDSGNNLDAISELEHTIQIEPQNATAFNDLGVLYYQNGNKEKALQCYEQAVRLDRRQSTFMKNLADFYLMEQGRIEDAMKLYVEVLENDPEDIDSLIATGLVCTKMNNFTDARSFFQRALEIDPWNADARQAMDHLDSYMNQMHICSDGPCQDTDSMKQVMGQ